MLDVERMLDEDVCNNSAWSYRYFLLHKSPVGTYTDLVPGSVEFVRREVEYAIKERLPYKWNNEACWVYVRGMLTVAEQPNKVNILQVRDILETKLLSQALPLAEKLPEEMGLRFMLMVQSDLMLAEGKKSEAQALMARLRDTVDPIRRNYWQWKINQLN